MDHPQARSPSRSIGTTGGTRAQRRRLDAFVEDRPDSFAFLGAGGGFLQGSNFRREANWQQALTDMGLDGLHFHDLRHTGSTLATQSGASLADLKVRMATTATEPH